MILKLKTLVSLLLTQLCFGQISVEAMNQKGNDYYYGKNGVKKNYEQAVGWYRKAAAQGNAVAQNDLGYMYRHGYGVKKDYEQAVVWYRKAAAQGDAVAQFNLGFMYEYGKGVPKSLSKAKYWFQKACDDGHQKACNRLKGL